MYQVGNFPAWKRWAEWNGKYRDDIRSFLKGDIWAAPEAVKRITGSMDLYGGAYLGYESSVNFITCHDGFTLYDLYAYNSKHNEDNGWKLLDEYGKELTEDADKSTAKYISTDVLSKQKESEKGENLLKPFNEDTYKRGGIIGPDYRDVQVEFRVTVPYNETERIVINEAQISEDSNKYGKDIEDKDSDPHEWTDCKEDDEDKEKSSQNEDDENDDKYEEDEEENNGVKY